MSFSVPAIWLAGIYMIIAYAGWRWDAIDRSYTASQSLIHGIVSMPTIAIGVFISYWYFWFILRYAPIKSIVEYIINIGGYLEANGAVAGAAYMGILILFFLPRTIKRIHLLMSNWIVLVPDKPHGLDECVNRRIQQAREEGKFIKVHMWWGEQVVDHDELNDVCNTVNHTYRYNNRHKLKESR